MPVMAKKQKKGEEHEKTKNQPEKYFQDCLYGPGSRNGCFRSNGRMLEEAGGINGGSR